MRFWSNKFIVSIAVMLFIACGDDGASIAKPDNDAENAISSSIEEKSFIKSKFIFAKDFFIKHQFFIAKTIFVQ